MKKLYLLLIPLLFAFKGCELFDLELKKVTYLLEAERRYVYESMFEQGGKSNDIRVFDRSDFNIPNSAEIKKFQIKNIWLSIDPVEDNLCSRTFLIYGVNAAGNLVLFEDYITITDIPLNDLLLNDQLSKNINTLRRYIEEAIKANKEVVLSYRLSCSPAADTHLIVIIRFDFNVEYINCEEVFSGSDLPEC